MVPETRYARTADGTHVAYQVAGDGPIDILLLRAWSTNLEHEWQEPILAGIYRRLGSLGRVIRLDRRGIGLSDRIEPASLPTLEDRIDDIRAVMDAAGSDRVAAVGLAHGGLLCAAFAAMQPERTSALVLWAPTPSMVGLPYPGDVPTALEELRRTWGTRERAAEIVREAFPSRGDDESLIEWIAGEEREGGSAEDAATQFELTRRTNLDDILPTIHTPTLVIWREQTGWAHVARRVAERIPDAVAAELPGRDHGLISGDWRRAVREIEDFLDRVRGADPDADRVLATVMFTDIARSTEQAARLGDSAWRELVDRHHLAVRRELARFRGREIDVAGDGFFAAFDGPARAIRCASAVRDALEGIRLPVRIGLHSGECERAGRGLRGLAVHIGARVGSLAHPGEILVSSTVRDLVVGSGIEFAEAGERELKGVPGSWRLYRVEQA